MLHCHYNKQLLHSATSLHIYIFILEQPIYIGTEKINKYITHTFMYKHNYFLQYVQNCDKVTVQTESKPGDQTVSLIC